MRYGVEGVAFVDVPFDAVGAVSVLLHQPPDTQKYPKTPYLGAALRRPRAFLGTHVQSSCLNTSSKKGTPATMPYRRRLVNDACSRTDVMFQSSKRAGRVSRVDFKLDVGVRNVPFCG